jgi:hypothetical protein
MVAMTAPFRLRPPVPLERDIHEACARCLNLMLLRPAEWWPYPAGASQLSPQQQARHSRIGLKRGLPDLWFLHEGRLYCIELKRPKTGRLSKTTITYTKSGSPYVLVGQEEMFKRLLAAGVREIAIATSVTEMLGHLERWRIPLRGMVAA